MSAVKKARTWLEDRGLLLPLAVVVAASVVLLPLIGTYGLWEPYEFKVADVARDVARKGGWLEIWKTQPPLTVWLTAASISVFGTTELAARLPLALLGVIGAVATYELGARLRRPRAGLYAALVLLASPLWVFQARQLTSEIATATAGAVAMLGLVGVAWPANGRRPGWLLVDGALAAVGLVMGWLAGGLVLGVLVPTLALALACATAAGAGFGREDDAPSAAPRRQAFVALGAGAVAIAVGALVAWRWGDKGYISVLGAAWRPGKAPSSATFDHVVEQVAFGMFPWSALAPLAVLRLAIPHRRDRDAWGGLVVVHWCAVAYLVATLWARWVGDLRYPALPAIALGVGIMLDDLVAARLEGDVARAPWAAAGVPLAALFVLAAGLQLSRDNLNFPDQLASVHLLATAKYPVAAKLLPLIVGFGLLWSLAAAAGLFIGPDRPGEARILALARRWARQGLRVAIGGGVVFGLFLALVYTPRLSEHFSYKNVFQCYFGHRRGAEPLGVMGIPGGGPEYYARGSLEKLQTREHLVSFLRQPERSFAIAPVTELCPIHQAAGREGWSAHVLDCRNSRFLLFSNQLQAGERDSNPLLKAITRTPPTGIKTPFSAIFVPSLAGQRGKVELIGYDIPAEVDKGTDFEVTLYFYVHEAPTTNYKVFMHFDRGVRFQGDHDPIAGLCGTSQWQAGDYIVDKTIVTAAGGAGTTKGEYTVNVGFFTGSHGNYRNMQVTTGNADAHNRVRLGTIRVR